MLTERANAKINLYLDVVGKRENGYHDIVSIMQTVSLCDLVTVHYLPTSHLSIQLSASGNADMPTDCRNLAWRAAERYLAAIGQSGEVRITIQKQIPMAAGLAGGSADAAAVLRAMNRLCGNRLSTEALCAIGARLGADVPFCIVGGGALCEGIGDRLTEVAPMPDTVLVVACMGEGVSTPWGYGRLDELHDNFESKTVSDPRTERILDAMKNGNILDACDDFYNIFEEIVPTVQPYVDRLKETMREHGALRAMMSGSGPSVFGVFRTVGDAERATAALTEMGASAFVCHPRTKYSH